ncbi:hypothetical protein ACWJJH_18725 [Endozoicomonadaceae bacterium StTr2]
MNLSNFRANQRRSDDGQRLQSPDFGHTSDTFLSTSIMMKIPQKKLLSLFLFLGFCLPLAETMANNRSDFKEIVSYEINNRLFAYKVVKHVSSKVTEGEAGAFWKAYAELEDLSQKKYQPVIDKYKIEPDNYIVSIKAFFSEAALKLFPETFIAVMHDATSEYATRLERLIPLCEASDIDFCIYAAAQEKVQANAMKYLTTGDYVKATIELNDFIRKTESTSYLNNNRKINTTNGSQTSKNYMSKDQSSVTYFF